VAARNGTKTDDVMFPVYILSRQPLQTLALRRVRLSLAFVGYTHIFER